VTQRTEVRTRRARQPGQRHEPSTASVLAPMTPVARRSTLSTTCCMCYTLLTRTQTRASGSPATLKTSTASGRPDPASRIDAMLVVPLKRISANASNPVPRRLWSISDVRPAMTPSRSSHSTRRFTGGGREIALIADSCDRPPSVHNQEIDYRSIGGVRLVRTGYQGNISSSLFQHTAAQEACALRSYLAAVLLRPSFPST
jgi:hypothetical protein